MSMHFERAEVQMKKAEQRYISAVDILVQRLIEKFPRRRVIHLPGDVVFRNRGRKGWELERDTPSFRWLILSEDRVGSAEAFGCLSVIKPDFLAELDEFLKSD
jgi:hypothetical protein